LLRRRSFVLSCLTSNTGCAHRLSARTLGFHPSKPGSTPGGRANYIATPLPGRQLRSRQEHLRSYAACLAHKLRDPVETELYRSNVSQGRHECALCLPPESACIPLAFVFDNCTELVGLVHNRLVYWFFIFHERHPTSGNGLVNKSLSEMVIVHSPCVLDRACRSLPALARGAREQAGATAIPGE
jgi:hypothetical protein